MIKRLWHELLYQITNLIGVKNDLGYIQKTTPVTVNKVKTMLNPIEDKEDKMTLTTETFFRHMSDDDFREVIRVGQIENLCNALAVDLAAASNIKKYEA